MRQLALAFAVVAFAGTPALADRCSTPPWRAVQGSVSPARACDAALITTDIDQGKALARWSAALPPEIRIALTLRRLDAQAGPLQIHVAGGWLLVDVGRFGFYTSEAAWAQTGWKPLPPPLDKLQPADPVSLEIAVAGHAVTASMAGHALGTWTVVDRPDVGVLELAFSAPRSSRSRIAISGWSVSGR